ncbi:MAG: cytochrome c [Burkholderiales bacterium]
MLNRKINRACLSLLLLTSAIACAQTESTRPEAVKPDSTKNVSTPIAAGRAKADIICATCHGKLGYSQLPNAPHLAGQPEIYLKEQLKAYRNGKRTNEVMAVIAKPLTDDEISNLAAWYASIDIKVGERQ